MSEGGAGKQAWGGKRIPSPGPTLPISGSRPAARQVSTQRNRGYRLPGLPRRGLLAAAVALASPARAQPWPDRPIRFVVPVSPGGSVDPLARLIGRHLGDALGQPVVVENHAGAGGNIAFELVARARPDGNTLLVGWDSLAINPAIFPRVDYDPIRDFAPVIQTVRTAQLLVVRDGRGVASLAEFLDLARRRSLTLGSPGNGSIGHLAAALLRSRAGVEWTHVPYRGGGPAMADLIAGHIDAVSLTLPAATEHVRAGRLRAIAVTTAARSPALPAVPTLAESGFPGFEVTSWQGLLAPAGTDPAVLRRLNAEVARILALPEVVAQLAAQGFEPVGGAPAVLAARLAEDVPRWPGVVALAGARVD
ncbi:tripartite tricarboxylate transporter substrate binding protein [Dankookia sp. GCM10030260]